MSSRHWCTPDLYDENEEMREEWEPPIAEVNDGLALHMYQLL